MTALGMTLILIGHARNSAQSAMAQEAQPIALPLDGPRQHGRETQGQYVYWICMPHPLDETVERHGIKKPSDFTRQTFREMMVEAHTHCGIELVETACFLEPHASGLPHLNLLVRAKRQYRWKQVAERVLQHHRAHVGFGSNVKTWAEGLAYGRVASENKGEEGLDQNPEQWHAQGTPTLSNSSCQGVGRNLGSCAKTACCVPVQRESKAAETTWSLSVRLLLGDLP